jgi:hypothetical protein
MATCNDIITDALKLARVISAGETPSAEEAADGLNCLQSMYDGWVVGGMFGDLQDVYLEEDDTALEGKRYYVPDDYTLTAAASEYVTESGVTRQPRDLALYEVLAGGVRYVRLYDRTGWVELTGLALTGDAPLASRGRMGLAAALAISGAFAALFGDTATLNPDVRKLGQRFTGNLMQTNSTRSTSGVSYF